MTDYSIDGLTAEAYKRFPETEKKPIIGLTANHSEIDATVREAYYHQIVKAGGVPMIIPPVADTSVVINTLEHLDALILTGGGDYDPRWCDEEPSPFLHTINAVRDPAELMITRLAYNRQIPMLGICRGMQTLAMALDGHVAQDIAEQQTTVCHDQKEDRPVATHNVTLTEDSILFSLYGNKTIKVNTFHHQAVDEPGKRFRCVAVADDGVIEAMESTEQKSIIGVQWHPEWLGNDGLPIFKWLVEQANEYRAACNLHNSILTLDTHCDTPMFFHQGVNFLERDPRILVDLHKMTEGHLDATFMVCYLPQPKDGKSFDEMVHFDIASPTAYTDFIFDKIEAFAKEKPDYLAIARSSADLYANKAEGKKSIVLGIENGLALDGNIDNVKHFADRGVAYITLCHNGDNDICDSARGTQTHGGVSAFGEKVIHEMNRQGIMVDLSHAAESSFYDAIEISKTPIVCSHSNCRALCDHPRNLTDDQLRALARCGGVAHTTFYPGFLNSAGEADILDAVRHLEHAIDIMGIDHVGIGTDFDGDGGVPGMANASEILNFTRQLLRRKYSKADITKIWGGNWLRFMDMAKAAKS